MCRVCYQLSVIEGVNLVNNHLGSYRPEIRDREDRTFRDEVEPVVEQEIEEVEPEIKIPLHSVAVFLVMAGLYCLLAASMSESSEWFYRSVATSFILFSLILGYSASKSYLVIFNIALLLAGVGLPLLATILQAVLADNGLFFR